MAARTKSTARHTKTPNAPQPAPAAPVEATGRTQGVPGPTGKLGAVAALLRRPSGARIDELTAVTGWQVHSIRGAMSGGLKKKLGLTITSEKTDEGRVYRIVDIAADAHS